MDTALYPRNCWYVVAHSGELGAVPLARRVLDQRLVLFRTESGVAVALEDRCIHRLLPLSRGRIVGENVQCGYHGAEFNAAGHCIAIPGQAAVPAGAQVRSYPVQERQGFVWAWMGEPAQAQGTPPCSVFSYLDDGDWRVLDGYLHLACSCLLVNDNLADISHTEFVHATTLGSGYVRSTRQDGVPPEQQGQHTFTSGLVDGGIDFRLRANGSRIAATFEKGFARFRGRDGWQDVLDFQLDYLFRPPGFWIFRPIILRPGDAVEDGLRIDGIIAITPETATTCHYFHKTGQPGAGRDAGETGFWHDQFGIAFLEDKAVLEAQQANMGDADLQDFPHVSFQGDRLGFLARRLVSGAAAAEHG